MSQIYTQDGVDVRAGDDFSSFAARICQATYGNSPFVQVEDLSRGNFRGTRVFRIINAPLGWAMSTAPDGSGTKPVLTNAAGNFHVAGREILAMCAGDITRDGGCPVLVNDILELYAVGERDTKTRLANEALLSGLGQAANEQRVVLFKGETAELKTLVGGDDPQAISNFLFAGFMLGLYHEKNLITGEGLRPGLAVVALRDPTLGCNGISTARKALAMHYGAQWWANPDAAADIQAAAAPSTLFDFFLATANGWYDPPNFAPRAKVCLLVHVTGGAFEGKLGRDILFPAGLSATLDNLWEPPEIMMKMAGWRGMSDYDIYDTWHGGQRVLAVMEESDVSYFCVLARKFGIGAQRCGQIESRQHPGVTIISRFSGKEVVYTPKP